jgi:Ca2+-transporting ATPase
MTITHAYVDGMDNAVTLDKSDDNIKHLINYGTLCSNGSVIFKEDGEQHIGDPTETAIVYASHMNGYTKEKLNELFPRVGEIPFDSDRKLMTTINKLDDHYIVIVKGAFDMMAPGCISGNIEKAKQITESMSAEALRVLAIGYKEINEVPDELTSEDLENGLSLMGLVGMIDPPRPEAKVAVSTCRRAGIKPVMITGDHVVTATAIAKELDIYRDGDKSITGAQLDAMTDSELDEEVEKISVYARVSPENKIRIVKAWQRKGQVVSMTGKLHCPVLQ